MFPSPDRLGKIQAAVAILKSGQATAKDFLHLLGLMASYIEVTPNARLFMRPIQLHLLYFWKPNTMSFKTVIPCTLHLVSHLDWWLQEPNINMGQSLQKCLGSVVLTTDASKVGFGGHMNNLVNQGVWSVSE